MSTNQGVPEGTEITITKPDDWHVHLRDGAEMKSVVGYTATPFRRALIMPNLEPPITTIYQLMSYRNQILGMTSHGFNPFMTLYLTNMTSPDEVTRAVADGSVKAMKLYPAGATTNSAAGVTDITKIYPVLERMQELGMALSVHGETSDPSVDPFDRERVFVENQLQRIVDEFPDLKIVLEHVSTIEGIQFVERQCGNVAATITAHHLLLNRKAIFVGCLRPEHFCLPILQSENHRLALLKAATSGSPKFFLGTDSAPHNKHAKHNLGRGGCFTAPVALGLYAEAFEQAEALDKLEGFASHFGADFYGLPRNTETITLIKDPCVVPLEYPFGGDWVVPVRSGGMVQWRVK